jgi:transcriptional regulator with XRE-family HTH domain
MITSKFKKQSLLVGSRIRTLRKDRALTQADLAARIGIQQSDLCRMENGEYKVSLETLFKILSIFEMNIADFFHEDLGGASRDREYEFLRQYQRLSPRAQEEVQEFVQFKQQLEDRLKKGN